MYIYIVLPTLQDYNPQAKLILLWILFPNCSYPFPHLTFFPLGSDYMQIEGKMGKHRDSGHLLHFLLCFSFSHFTLCNGKGWVRRCHRLLVLSRRLSLLGQQKLVQAMQHLPQLEAPCMPVQSHLPLSCTGSHPTLCSQHWSRTAELSATSHKRPIFTPHNCSKKKKNKFHESWQPVLNLHAYLISCVFRKQSLTKYCKIIHFIF